MALDQQSEALMIRMPRSGFCLLVTIACMAGVACHLRRPETTPSRMIEPQLLEPKPPEQARQVPKAPNAASVRLLDTQALSHIGRRVLHQQSNGELTQDSVWRWSSGPDRYLDTALRLEVASRPDVRLVDVGRAPGLAATFLVWDLESEGGTRLVGVVEFQITGIDRVLQTQLVRSSEPVSAELPGNLAAAAGRLLHRFASEGLTFVESEPYRMK